MSYTKVFSTVTFCLCLSAGIVADEWQSPQVREVFSPDRQYFVRITPGESWGETWGFKGAKIGKHAQAAFFHEQPDKGYRLERTIDLPNPVAPVEVFLSNKGYMVTLDNWHNRGYGAVLVLYQWDSKMMKAYNLEDLFPRKEIDSFPHSVSSILWHKGPTYITEDQKTFYMGYKEPPDYREFILDLGNGSVRLCAGIPKYHCWSPASARASRQSVTSKELGHFQPSLFFSALILFHRFFAAREIRALAAADPDPRLLKKASESSQRRLQETNLKRDSTEPSEFPIIASSGSLKCPCTPSQT